MMLSGLPDAARKMPDRRQPDATIRSAVRSNSGVSTLAVRLNT
jgi:hypothetical protein